MSYSRVVILMLERSLYVFHYQAFVYLMPPNDFWLTLTTQTWDCVSSSFSQHGSRSRTSSTLPVAMFTLSLATFGPAFSAFATGLTDVTAAYGVCFTKLLLFFGCQLFFSSSSPILVVIPRLFRVSPFRVVICSWLPIVTTCEYYGIFVRFCSC